MATKQTNRIKALGDNRAEIWIYEEISDFWGKGAVELIAELSALGLVDEIVVRINSPGGDVFEAAAMYNVLKQHPAKVTVEIDGMAVSAASVLAMVGDTIRMADNAMMMIHDPWGGAVGNASEHRQYADLLEKVGETLVATYANRTGRPADEIRPLMAAETWMDAEEALAGQFIDEIVAGKQVAARFDPDRFNNCPQQFAERAKTAPAPTLHEYRNRLDKLTLAATNR